MPTRKRYIPLDRTKMEFSEAIFDDKIENFNIPLMSKNDKKWEEFKTQRLITNKKYLSDS